MMEIPNKVEFMFKLASFSHLLESETSLEEGLREVAAFSSQTLKTQRCSIMLLAETDDAEPGLRLFTHYGNVPDLAYKEITRLNDGIAGYVAATGQSLLIADISQSKFATMARYASEEENKSLMSTPIYLGEQVIGVINVSGCENREWFDEQDLELLRLFALFVGKSIHIAQLQTIMRSKFVERAVLLDWEERNKESLKTASLSPSAIAPDPNKLAKIVAKSFFKELTQAGFSTNQIIAIATEVLNLLQNSLNKHKKRLARDEGDSEFE